VRSRDVEAKYLLTGFGRCAICGGVWRGHTRDHGREQVGFYGCANHEKRGVRVCSNGMVARTAAIDAEVIATLAEDVLRPTVISQAIGLALDELAPAGANRVRRTLEAELTKVTTECGRLAEAIGPGGRLTPLLDRLTRLDARADALRAELAACATPALIIDRTALERRLHVKLDDWRGLLTRNLTTGRDVLRLVLAGPIRFTPVSDERRRGYRLEGAIALDRMIGGVLETYPNGTSPEGLDTLCMVDHDWIVPAA
jgi:hypothetical protein